MSRRKILLQLDTDSRPSVFDSVVAVDSGVEFLLPYSSVTPENVRDLVYGAIFTRGPADLKSTAIFVGGSQVAAGEAVVKAIQRTFLGPLRVSVLMDSNGANTTAAAAVLAAGKHVDLSAATVLVLGGTGPVGQRVVRLLAARGAAVRVASRSIARAHEVCAVVGGRSPGAKLVAVATETAEQTESALEGAQVVVAAGAAGVELLSAEARRRCPTLKVAIDLNAVPPVGLSGIAPPDRGVDQNGALCYGAIGVGGTKMKIHKAALAKLFDANDQVLDAEEVYQLGRGLPS